MDGMLAGKIVITAGFGLWSLINVYNHLADFRGSLQAVADFMRMTSLDAAPPIPSPLKKREIESPLLHRLAFIAITIVHGALGALFVVATVFLVSGQIAAGLAWATWAFALACALWLLFLLGDSWFAGWIRLDALQRTHITLLATAMLGLILMGA
ncbi:DUF2165 family protein [Bauldia litoralis]|uniref:DUF2165 family protein n=1 Tax=Bauldia litoralis TaxID=665467 RepID=UPI0032637B2A